MWTHVRKASCFQRLDNRTLDARSSSPTTKRKGKGKKKRRHGVTNTNFRNISPFDRFCHYLSDFRQAWATSTENLTYPIQRICRNSHSSTFESSIRMLPVGRGSVGIQWRINKRDGLTYDDSHEVELTRREGWVFWTLGLYVVPLSPVVWTPFPFDHFWFFRKCKFVSSADRGASCNLLSNVTRAKHWWMWDSVRENIVISMSRRSVTRSNCLSWAILRIELRDTRIARRILVTTAKNTNERPLFACTSRMFQYYVSYHPLPAPGFETVSFRERRAGIIKKRERYIADRTQRKQLMGLRDWHSARPSLRIVSVYRNVSSKCRCLYVLQFTRWCPISWVLHEYYEPKHSPFRVITHIYIFNIVQLKYSVEIDTLTPTKRKSELSHQIEVTYTRTTKYWRLCICNIVFWRMVLMWMILLLLVGIR